MTIDSERGFGWGWISLCAAFAAHIVDEAMTGFLDVYNPTVLTLRHRWDWFPMPPFHFRDWLLGLVIAFAILVGLTVFAFDNKKWLRPLAYLFAVIMLLNGLGHTAFSVLGRTVPEVRFPRPAPGFYSSPFLILASLYLLSQLLRTRQQR